MSVRAYSILDETKEEYAFWETMWLRKVTPWVLKDVCPFLKKFSSKINFASPKRAFIPFCGKAVELKWFYDMGFEVVGVEWITIPIEEFFKEHNLSFEVKQLSWAKVYVTSDQRLKIYVADIYKIKTEEVGKFDVIWGRADYTVVKIAEREKYAKLMKQLCKEKFVYFLCTLQFEVAADRIDATPRPLSHEDVRKLYDDWCKIELTGEVDAMGIYPEFKTTTDKVTESYFLLTPKK